MCGPSGPSSSQTAQINQSNAQNQRNFDTQQELAERQLQLNESNANRSHAFNVEQAAANRAAANASFGLALEQLGLQKGEIARQIAREAEREAKIQGSIKSIDEAFAGRDQIFDQLRDDTVALNRDALTENRDVARRNTGFALARSGNRFGQLEIDKGSEINKRFADGVLDSEVFADGIANSARGRDASLRQGLLSSAATGIFDGQQLVSGAAGTLESIANTEGGLSSSAANRSYFNDIPGSINSLSSLFSGNLASGAGGGQSFRPGQSRSGGGGRVSTVGV